MHVAVDPVCKMDVDEATAKFTSEYRGKTYFFERDPEAYLKES